MTTNWKVIGQKVLEAATESAELEEELEGMIELDPDDLDKYETALDNLMEEVTRRITEAFK